MFSQFRLASQCARTCPRLSIHHYTRCNNSLTHLTRREFSDLSPEPPAKDDLDDDANAPDLFQDVLGDIEKKGKGETRQAETYKEFMTAAGENFRKADGPNKWLGGRVVEFVFLHRVSLTKVTDSIHHLAISHESFI